jgi:hypothetical protein
VNKQFVVALTVGLAIPAFILSRIIWPDPPGAPTPPAGLLPWLIVPAAFEALSFGAGVAFLVTAGRALVRSAKRDGLALTAYAFAGWALLSWTPHSNMHRVNTTFEGLILIDWVFHLTLIVGAAVIGTYLYTMVNQERPRPVNSRGGQAATAEVAL